MITTRKRPARKRDRMDGTDQADRTNSTKKNEARVLESGAQVSSPEVRTAGTAAEAAAQSGPPMLQCAGLAGRAPAWWRKPYQAEVFRALEQYRCFILLWRRQGYKSSTLAECGMFEMMRYPGRLVTHASASILMGREMILKESEVMQRAINQLISQCASAGTQFELADSHTHRVVTGYSPDDFTDLFEAQRLEFRLYHDRSVYSRTQIIAPNPATARGWTGTVFLDEFGFIRDFRQLWEAVEPIVSSNPEFHLVMATTPPVDDSHYSYELTAPPIGLEFTASAAGNWYRSEAGKLVHRVDIDDAHLAGVKLFDLETGKELTPQEHFERADDKNAWRRNYKVQHVLGGVSAIGLLSLDTAQRRGAGSCRCFEVDGDAEFSAVLDWLHEHLSGAPVGLGWDLATTTEATSNPSAFAVVEENGVEIVVRAVLVWKTSNPSVQLARARAIVETVAGRAEGGRARRLCIDSSNERLFASTVRTELQALVPVEGVVGSETAPKLGDQGPVNMKQYLGGLYSEMITANHASLPPEKYVKDDHRMVKKEKGQFICKPNSRGMHGDTFDAGKLGLYALQSRGDCFTSENIGQVSMQVVGSGGYLRPMEPVRFGTW